MQASFSTSEVAASVGELVGAGLVAAALPSRGVVLRARTMQVQARKSGRSKLDRDGPGIIWRKNNEPFARQSSEFCRASQERSGVSRRVKLGKTGVKNV